MAYLKDPREERFAQLMATGWKEGDQLSQKQACIEAGWGHLKRPDVMGAKLYARPHIRKRIDELREKVEASVVVTTGISKGMVIQRLWEEANKENNPASVKVRALEVLWKEFVLMERQGGYDIPDSPDQCTDDQLMQIQKLLLRWVCGKDQNKARDMERDLSIEVGLVIDVPRQEPISEF